MTRGFQLTGLLLQAAFLATPAVCSVWSFYVGLGSKANHISIRTSKLQTVIQHSASSLQTCSKTCVVRDSECTGIAFSLANGICNYFQQPGSKELPGVAFIPKIKVGTTRADSKTAMQNVSSPLSSTKITSVPFAIAINNGNATTDTERSISATTYSKVDEFYFTTSARLLTGSTLFASAKILSPILPDEGHQKNIVTSGALIEDTSGDLTFRYFEDTTPTQLYNELSPDTTTVYDTNAGYSKFSSKLNEAVSKTVTTHDEARDATESLTQAHIEVSIAVDAPNSSENSSTVHSNEHVSLSSEGTSSTTLRFALLTGLSVFNSSVFTLTNSDSASSTTKESMILIPDANNTTGSCGPFDTTKFVCCSGVLNKLKGDPVCCGNVTYNVHKDICCYGVVSSGPAC